MLSSHDFDRKRRHQRTRHSMHMAMSGGIALAMDVIVIGLLECGRQIGQFSIGRVHDNGCSARLVIVCLLPFDVECGDDGGVAPNSLQVRVPVGLPGRLELRGLSKRCNRN